MTGRSLLRPDLQRTWEVLDKAADKAVIIDAQGDAWQFSRYTGYWYRAFDGEGRSSFEVAQVAHTATVIGTKQREAHS